MKNEEQKGKGKGKLAESVERMRLELERLGERDSRTRSVLVGRGRGIFSVERKPVDFFNLSQVQPNKK